MSVYIFEELCKKVNIYVVLGTRYSGNEIERRDRLTNSCGLYIPSKALEAIFFDYYIVLLALRRKLKAAVPPFLLQYINLSF